MVEGKYIHIEIVIAKTALWSRKEALRESNFKRYGRSRMYTQLYTYKIWFPKRPFRARKQLYGNQISRGIVEGKYIHIGNLIPKTALLSQKEALRESNFKRYGRRRMYTHRNLIPKTALLSQKEALRESNFKRYGRRQIYTHRKFDSQNGHFEPESSFTGIKFQEVL